MNIWSGFKTTENVSRLLNISIEILEMDWDVMNPNKMFRTRENISRNFQKLGLALEN